MHRTALLAFVVMAVAGALMVFGSSGFAGPTNAQGCPEADDPRCEVPERPSEPPILDVPGDSNDEAIEGQGGPLGPQSEETGTPTTTATSTPEPTGTVGAQAVEPTPGTLLGTPHWVPMIARDGPPPPTPTPTPTPTPRATPTPRGPVIYLTFDDGPHPTWTPRLLDVLGAHNVRATFFQLGSNVDAYPAITARVQREGHALANHTYNHRRLTNLSWYGVRDQLSWTNSAILDAGGDRPSCMRPPYGAYNSTVRDAASSLGLALWTWTVDPRDWERPGASAIASRVVNAASAEAVVLMHDGGGTRDQTVAAADSIIRTLKGRGYRFATLPGC